MPRESDQDRKLRAMQRTNPTQQLEPRVAQLEHGPTGYTPPPAEPTPASTPTIEEPLLQPNTPISTSSPTPRFTGQAHAALTQAAQPPALSPLAAAQQSLLRQVVNQNRDQSQKFHLVVVPESGELRVLEFEDVESLIVEIRRHLNTPTWVVPFMGARFRISTGEHKFMSTPYGALPLFAIPPENELDFSEDGYLGAHDADMAIPSTETEPRHEEPSAETDQLNDDFELGPSPVLPDEED